MNLIGLNRQFDQLPLVLMDKLINNLLESLFHRSTKKSTPLVRAKDQMIDKKVDTVSILAESAEEHEGRAAATSSSYRKKTAQKEELRSG